VITRADKPDTEADRQLRHCLEQSTLTNFVMVAGAGSGKTTSLVKALDHLMKTRGTVLKRRGQRVACITYTEVAEKEIWADVGNAPLVHVSTVHSFLWTVIKPFQDDIRSWVAEQLAEKIKKSQEKIAAPRTHKHTRERAQLDIVKFEAQRNALSKTSRFTYGAGSDYQNLMLGHEDVIKMVPMLLLKRPLLRTLVAERFPFIFVDESQDTGPDVVKALREIANGAAGRFCLGFFGDAMQKIYMTGVGRIDMSPEWVCIAKPENFRCSDAVLSVVNKIRAGGDQLVQTRGGVNQCKGTARLFVLPIDDCRTQRLDAVKNWIAKENNDPDWASDDEGAVRILVLVHKMAAKRLGFSDLYAALSEKAPASIKNGFLDGTAWAVKPFLSYLLPLAKAVGNGHEFDVMSLLRVNCPRLGKDNLARGGVSELLQQLKEDTAKLATLFSSDSTATVRDVIRFIDDCGLARLDSRFIEYLSIVDDGTTIAETAIDDGEEEVSRENRAIIAYMKCPATQFWGYQSYVEDESPFFTQQGIKGAEFKRVLTLVDDDEGSHAQFSYNKYFGIARLSDTDRKNQVEGKETVVDRTRRLFYVCCSRAIQDLAVVVFAQDVSVAEKKILEMGLFPPEQVRVFADLPEGKSTE